MFILSSLDGDGGDCHHSGNERVDEASIVDDVDVVDILVLVMDPDDDDADDAAAADAANL